ncbi:hypothetical protein ANCCAN_07446 [Ancylostoma caninum]|uniref:Uncharacterized protein n=1 Tax=Ancylostoma caninum TaxID=29170 RepID=A0A368GQE3_ANCCA|nr:hypothetical protein ANCCAN_07446 [Ancylostoma caninum]
MLLTLSILNKRQRQVVRQCQYAPFNAGACVRIRIESYSNCITLLCHAEPPLQDEDVTVFTGQYDVCMVSVKLRGGALSSSTTITSMDSSSGKLVNNGGSSCRSPAFAFKNCEHDIL